MPSNHTVNYSRIVFLLLTLLLTACASTEPPIGNPPNLTNANVFVNQVAFNIHSPKHAIISLPSNQKASRFIVYQGQNRVYQGALIKQSTFDDWGKNVDYYLADFSSINRRGEFHVVVNTRQQQLISSTFVIDHNAYFQITARYILDYLHSLRDSSQDDKHIRLEDSDRAENLSGGWFNSATSQQKSLIQLPFHANTTTQQISLAVWALAKSYASVSTLYDKNSLTDNLAEQVVWGADYLHRSLSDNGFFYTSVYGNDDHSDDRLIASYDSINQEYIAPTHTHFSDGAGLAIASLVRAYELSQQTGIQGKFSARQYLADAERAFRALQSLQENGVSNPATQHIASDYTALIAASELYRVTKNPQYLTAARTKADRLNNRLTSQGWFSAKNNSTPYFQPVEAGFPVIALAQYLAIERNVQRQQRAKQTIKHALNYTLNLTSSVSNPFNLARQSFNLSAQRNSLHAGFFMPHNDPFLPNWQGENGRLASLTAAAIWGGKITHSDKQGPFGIEAPLANFAQSQIDWLLGKNPYNTSMLYGLGIKNPEPSSFNYVMRRGGISNGITGATFNLDGSGITWNEATNEQSDRWLEQPITNSLWYLLAISAISE